MSGMKFKTESRYIPNPIITNTCSWNLMGIVVLFIKFQVMATKIIFCTSSDAFSPYAVKGWPSKKPYNAPLQYTIPSPYKELREIPAADCEFIILTIMGTLLRHDPRMIATPNALVRS